MIRPEVSHIIDSYYPEKTELRDILLRHSSSVRDMSLSIARRHPELNADMDILENGSMLHDIGIVFCDAPGIGCHGTHRYIMHGRLGAELLRNEGMEEYARIAERHTGTGLTAEMIEKQHLPLPVRDFTPETIEEQIICYADKFFSKSRLDSAKSYEEARKSISKFGDDCVAKFDEWHKKFS
ncbi:MAG: HDIG domain-containing protein [Paludibacteraceae bacterium]|nr:HDIG domain-containing protein [Paludibacteraceae bacterium]